MDQHEGEVMNRKPSAFSTVKRVGEFLTGKREEPEPEDEMLTEGVPLVKLVKRRLIDAPEVVMLASPSSIQAERFRRLKVVLAQESEAGPRVIVVTSPGPSDGKSLTALNLALAFAADKRGEVLLLDADLRLPSVESFVSPHPHLGFSELLQGKTTEDHVILEADNADLKILPAGEPPRDPVELLSSPRTESLMAALRERFSWIIVDTPPAVPFTDADVIGAHSDGFLMVARSEKTSRSLFEQALGSVTTKPILGTVLNDVTFHFADWNKQGYKYYHHYYQRGNK